MIKKYWYLNPDQTLRLIITDIIRNNNLGDLNFINQIIKSNTNNEESRKMLIYFAIKTDNFLIDIWSLVPTFNIGSLFLKFFFKIFFSI